MHACGVAVQQEFQFGVLQFIFAAPTTGAGATIIRTFIN